MLYRKIKLSTFGLYLKAVSKLWLVPLLTVNVLVPVISAVLYKNGGAGAESDIVTVMYFLLPISTVWTSALPCRSCSFCCPWSMWRR